VGVQPYTIKPSTLVTLYRQTWIYFLNSLALHYKSFIAGHIIPANVDILSQQISPTLQILHLWSHYTGKRGHTSSADQPYTINPSSLLTLYRQTWSYFLNRSALHYKNLLSLLTLYRQTWSYFHNRSALHYKNPLSLVTLYWQTWTSFPNRSVLHCQSSISGHTMLPDTVMLSQQVDRTL
jgi:hypothetical protein